MKTRNGNKPSSAAARARLSRGHCAEKPAPFPPSIRINKILLAIDFSAPTQFSMRYAKAFARRFGARVVLLHVVEPVASTADYGYGPVVRLRPDPRSLKRSQQHLHAIERRKLDSGCRCETMVRSGVAFEEIAKAAKELNVDLIIVATHSHRGAKQALNGSTAERLVRLAACPVLVVHEKEREWISPPASASRHFENQACN